MNEHVEDAEQQEESEQEELEQRVFDRTAQLAAANRDLSREIAERKRIEQELRQSEQRFNEQASRDDSERKRTEAERGRLLEELEEAVRVRDEFLAIASHEFKTPVTALQLQVQAILTALERSGLETPMVERLAARLQIARRQIERLTRLVDGLLDITHVAAGRFQVEFEDVDLRAVVADVIAREADEIRRAGCCVELAFGGPLVGRWDRLRLEQIVSNLMSNAVKFGARKPIRVSAALDATSNVVRLEIADEGIGIPESDQQRIFDRFGRAVSGRNYGGFGLGLWMARQAARALGGEIGVRSRPGAGATFVVTLPRKDAPDDA